MLAFSSEEKRNESIKYMPSHEKTITVTSTKHLKQEKDIKMKNNCVKEYCLNQQAQLEQFPKAESLNLVNVTRVALLPLTHVMQCRKHANFWLNKDNI